MSGDSTSSDGSGSFIAASIILAVINLIDARNFQFDATNGDILTLGEVRSYPVRVFNIFFWASVALAITLCAAAAFAGLRGRGWIFTVVLLMGALAIQIGAIVQADVSYIQDATFTIRTWNCPVEAEKWSLTPLDERCTPRPVDAPSWLMLPDLPDAARAMSSDPPDEVNADGIAPDDQGGNVAVWTGLPRGKYKLYLAFQGEHAPYGPIMLVLDDTFFGTNQMRPIEAKGVPYWYVRINTAPGRRIADAYFIADRAGDQPGDPGVPQATPLATSRIRHR